ncbi:hypothetical protein B0T20DRAFT_77160 [Sordaria brevicollis]|uniref:Uncharacterized protein n=1 Tax=Sordaria brevicollis TaxID=83679 RepID=A0AAE0U522_SORBR|nr:hypothetical protein B0T20DRAFT_77160 [Sordaria brevicollis]
MGKTTNETVGGSFPPDHQPVRNHGFTQTVRLPRPFFPLGVEPLTLDLAIEKYRDTTKKSGGVGRYCLQLELRGRKPGGNNESGGLLKAGSSPVLPPLHESVNFSTRHGVDSLESWSLLLPVMSGMELAGRITNEKPRHREDRVRWAEMLEPGEIVRGNGQCKLGIDQGFWRFWVTITRKGGEDITDICDSGVLGSDSRGKVIHRHARHDGDTLLCYRPFSMSC